jgi:hypothetical protein
VKALNTRPPTFTPKEAVGSPTIRFTIPIRTGGGLNARMHWAQRSRIVQLERKATALSFPWWAKSTRPPVDVLLVRVGPGTRPMDDDNLRGSLKGVRDEIAKQLGVDDGQRSLIRFDYGQERGVWSVRVEIRPRA